MLSAVCSCAPQLWVVRPQFLQICLKVEGKTQKLHVTHDYMNIGLNVQVILLKDCKILTEKREEKKHHKEGHYALFESPRVRG